MARRAILGPIYAALVAMPAVFTSRVAAASAAVEISGNVTNHDGAAIMGAVVTILSTRSPSGDGNPADGSDNGKQAVTDGSGSYKLGDFRAGLELTLSAEARDHHPRLRTVTVDSSRRVSFTLVSKSATPDGSQYQFAGQVLRPDGKPAAGAIVSRQKDETRVGRARNRIVAAGAVVPGAIAGTQDFEPWTKTDEEGNFFILTAVPAGELAVSVDAEGAVKRQVFQLWRGRKPNTCQLIVGATVSGRVLRDTRPAEGVAVGIALASPEGTLPPGNYEAATDRDGRFVIEHVPPDRGCLVFTKMGSLAEANLAAIKQEIHTGRDRQVIEMAELNLHPAHTLRGRLVFSEPPPVMPHVDVVLSRTGVADSQRVSTDEQGEFAFNGVPSESVSLSFHEFGMPSVLGYRLSARHRSLDLTRKSTLCGRVDEDLNLVVLFEPGEAPIPPPPPTVEGPVVRMVVQQPGGIRRVVQMPAAQLQRNLIFNDRHAQPLRGIDPEVLPGPDKK